MAVDKKEEKRERAARVEKMFKGGTGEPTIRPLNSRIDLMLALNWYNAHEDTKVIRKYAEAYVKSIGKKEYLPHMAKATDAEVKSIGVIGRLLSRDQYVDDAHIATCVSKLASFKQRYPIIPSAAKVETVSKFTPNIQDHINEQFYTHLTAFDLEVDKVIKGQKTDFSAKAYMISHSIKAVASKRLGANYAHMLKELTEAVAGKCEQLNEGYSHLSKTQLKNCLSFVQSIVNDCTDQVARVKVFKPKKIKPASVVVSKLSYMKEFKEGELSLKSVSPTAIVGCTELWVYSTDTRKLSVFKALDNGTLSVKGMSISNYDPTASEIKTVRYPDKLFAGLVLGKRNLNKSMKDLNTRAGTPKGRINDTMILLGAY